MSTLELLSIKKIIYNWYNFPIKRETSNSVICVITWCRDVTHDIYVGLGQVTLGQVRLGYHQILYSQKDGAQSTCVSPYFSALSTKPREAPPLHYTTIDANSKAQAAFERPNTLKSAMFRRTHLCFIVSVQRGLTPQYIYQC